MCVQVAEGVTTAGVVVALAARFRVFLPVLTAVAQVCPLFQIYFRFPGLGSSVCACARLHAKTSAVFRPHFELVKG